MAEKELDVRIRISGDTSGAKQAEAALKGVKAEAAQAGKGVQQAGNEAEGASKKFRGMGAALGGLRNAWAGIEAGNPVAVIRGLTTAVLGLGTAVVGVAAALAGPLLAAIIIMKKETEANAKAMTDMWENATRQTKAYKDGVTAAKDSASKDLAAMTADVERLTGAYTTLIGQMATASARSKELASARRELALAQAGTPEEKAAVEARFDKAGVETEGLQAGVREQNAREAYSNMSQQSGQIRAKTEAARSKSRAATARAAEFSPGNDSQEARVARTQAAIAADAVKFAEANEKDALGKLQPGMDKAQQEIESARTTKEAVGIRGKALAINTYKNTATTQGMTKERRADLTAKAEAAQASGDFKGQAAIVAELDKARKAEAGAYKALMEDAKLRAKEADKIKQQIKNTRETKGGR